MAGGFAAGAWAVQACEVPPEFTRSRPDPEGVPTRVEAELLTVDLRSINDSQQSFNGDIVLLLKWMDPRLKSVEGGLQLAGCRVPLSAVWSPRPEVINERDVDKRLPEVAQIQPDGSVVYSQRYMGEFTSPLFLKDFPFDSHQLLFHVVAAGHTPEEVVFDVAEDRLDRMDEFSIADWSIGGASITTEPVELAVGKFRLAALNYRLEVRRETGFYVWKVFVPLCLIVFMSWAVFYINPSYLPPQVGVSTSAVLTLIAFQFSLGYLLPKLSYLTRADRFVMGSAILVFLAFGEALLTSSLADRERVELAHKIDAFAKVAFPLGFVAVMAFSFLL